MILNVHGWFDFKGTPFKTLSSGVWSEHSWEEIHFWWFKSTSYQFLDTLHIFGTWGFPGARVVFCLEFFFLLPWLIPSPPALFAEEGVKWYWGTLLTHPPPPPPPLLLPASPALLNVLQHGQKARHRVGVTESGSVVVDKLYLNQGQGCSETSIRRITIC